LEEFEKKNEHPGTPEITEITLRINTDSKITEICTVLKYSCPELEDQNGSINNALRRCQFTRTPPSDNHILGKSIWQQGGNLPVFVSVIFSKLFYSSNVES
jgi:hypothetical protein